MPTNTLTEPSYTRCINHCNAFLPSCQFETMIIGPPIPPHKCPHKWHTQYTILWISCSQSQCLETHDLWLLSTYNEKQTMDIITSDLWYSWGIYNHVWLAGTVARLWDVVSSICSIQLSSFSLLIYIRYVIQTWAEQHYSWLAAVRLSPVCSTST